MPLTVYAFADKQTLAQFLRKARVDAGVSQQAAADHLQLHRPAITEIEAGRRDVSALEFLSLLRVYGVELGGNAEGGESLLLGFQFFVFVMSCIAYRQHSFISGVEFGSVSELAKMALKFIGAPGGVEDCDPKTILSFVEFVASYRDEGERR